MNSSVKLQEWDAILARLSQELAQPTGARPSVQAMTEMDLRHCLRKACDAAASGKSALTTLHALKLLESCGLAARVSLEGMEGKPVAVKLWRIGFGAMPEISPLELLQAAKPKGIVCYFSELAHHELTTQMPSHHHIAMLDKRERLEVPAADSYQADKIPPMGTFLFRHATLPYYWTRRLDSMVPGAEWTYLGDKTLIRITTLEQTLLDTLHRPWNCGGPAVVFEAWETGVKRLDEERLCGYLQSINNPLWTRRAGCMLDLCGHRIADAQLDQLLATARASSASAPVASLLPAVPGNRMDSAWQMEFT